MKNIALIGAKGMLGTEIAKFAETASLPLALFDLPEFDITNHRDLEMLCSSFKTVINCAAFTNVDGAETHRDRCREINASAVGQLGKIAFLNKTRVIHISTDFVFGDTQMSPLNEKSPVNPLCHYGATKLEGECLLSESNCEHVILRVEWTYGRHGNNFIRKIIERAKSMSPLKVVSDQIGSPTHTAEIAKAVFCLVREKVDGLFHFAADGYASRFEVAKFVLVKKTLETEILPCISSELKSPAVRPKNSMFDCSKIDKILDFKRKHWQDELSCFLEKS